MAILELTLQSIYFGQECVNRFHYVSSGDPATVTPSFGLMFAAGMVSSDVPVPGTFPPGALFARIRDASSVDVTFTQATVFNLYDAFDFYEAPFVTQPGGVAVGQSMSPTQAYGFRSSRTRTDIRRGMKRFVGVNETQAGPGGIIDEVFLTTQLADLATALGAVITYDDEGNTISYAPVILGKNKVTEVVNGEEKTFYRKYPTEAEQLQHVAQGIAWSPYNAVRTQNSRQYGRGR